MYHALKWFRLAADQGHPGAQNMLGSMYPLDGGNAALRPAPFIGVDGSTVRC
jgi:TPR repeat protein